MKKMLLVFAHPDDESLAVGGTVAKYVRVGWQADLICATRGEAAGEPGAHLANLGDIRTRELTRAGQILGISSITFLDYPDGKLFNLHPGELEDKIAQVIQELQPDIVITFDTTGITNDPDHIKVCFATTFAFQKYAKDRQEENEKRKDPKLYYVCIPKTLVEYLQRKKLLPALSFDKPWRGTDDRRITAVIDIKRFGSAKKKALFAHVSQRGNVERFLSLPKQPLLAQEYFILRMVGAVEAFMGKNDQVSNKL